MVLNFILPGTRRYYLKESFRYYLMVYIDDNLVCISALIDSSGSMANLDTKELAEGLTRMIKDQTSLGKKVVFYGAKFSDDFTVFANGVDGNNIKITKDDIQPDGMTALYPAFGRMIRYTGKYKI